MLLTLIATSIWTLPVSFAVEPPPTGNPLGEYKSDYGVLHNDTYVLYPYEEKSINIGFSKYGEMIDGEMGLGLGYKGASGHDVDVFANSAVERYLWCNGWIMDIHYTQGRELKNVWAYALFSDRSGAEGVEGDWQNLQRTKDASHPLDDPGGRRTNGVATSDPIRLIYDGPRKAIYLLNTTIYDKEEEDANCLVQLTIQLVFDKVSKNVMEIKDIKRCDDNKLNGPFQIEFSQRAEWDIGLTGASESYAEFYEDIPTKYDKHPFYTIPGHGGTDVTFDLCQIIGEENLVGYAAYWPPLISKWVTDVADVAPLGENPDLPYLLSTMETYEYTVTLPTSEDELENPAITRDGDYEILIELPKEPVSYPRGMGEWSTAPWVYQKDEQGVYEKMTEGLEWIWQEGTGGQGHGQIRLLPFQWHWGDEFKIVYKRVMQGDVTKESTALDCMPWEGFQADQVVNSTGMYKEPETPYVFAEWDFDLDMDHPENSTHQFRCVSVYGLTDNHNAVDPDMDSPMTGKFLIDKEVVYQLEQIFNPIDLKDAAHKDTFRWAQKGTIPSNGEITLTSHECLGDPHVVWKPEKWGYYCQDSEKVLVFTESGEILLERDEGYTFDAETALIDIDDSYAEYAYKVLYTTVLLPEDFSIDETDFAEEDPVPGYDIDVTREFHRDYVKWIFDFDRLPGLSMSAVDLIFKSCSGNLTKVGFAPGQATGPIMKKYPPHGWSSIMDLPPDIIVTPDNLGEMHYEILVPYKYFYNRKCIDWALYVQADWASEPDTTGASWKIFPDDWGSWGNPLENLYSDGICWHTGQWEWTVLGATSAPTDSLGASMVSSAWSDWKNVEVWLSGLDYQDTVLAPHIPWLMRNFTDTTGRDAFYYAGDPAGLERTAFKDDWCTPEDWSGETIRPYAVSSSNMLVVGGPINNLAAEYSNDFTDALIFTEYDDIEYGAGFYGPGCWARTVLDHYEGDELIKGPDDVLWYNSSTTLDDVGYAMVSVYKDLNETVGFVVYGYTAEDTYYTCYALRGGLLDWMQHLQDGVTTLIIEIDYESLHPVKFHVKESLGKFTECTGFGTDFKCHGYYINKGMAESMVEAAADCLGLCYKLVDIEWCAQVHPDP